MEPFEITREIPSDAEMLEHIKDYTTRANELMPRLGRQEPYALVEARALRTEMGQEWKKYDRMADRKVIVPGSTLAEYTEWIQDAYVKTAGRLDYRKAIGFVYDVEDYAFYHLQQFKWRKDQ